MKNFTTKQILANKQRWLTDIVAFSQEVFPHYINPKFGVPDFHKEIYREYMLDDPNWGRLERQIVIKCFRGSSKTTTAQMYITHCIVFQKKHFIIILSETGSQALDLLAKVKIELEHNQILRQHFGPLNIKLTKDEYNKWRQNDVITSTGIRIWTRGINQGIRGTGHMQYRPDLLIADDLESEKNTGTPEMMQKNRERFMRGVQQAVDLFDGQVVYLYTPVHEDCIGERLQENDGWRKSTYGAYTEVGTENGEPLWPERFPRKRLAKLKKQFVDAFDLTGWAMEYLCDVKSEETAICKREWLQDYDGEYFFKEGKHWLITNDKKEGEKKFPIDLSVGVDLHAAEESQKGSKTAFVVIGTDENNHTWHIETRAGYPSAAEYVDWFFEFDTKYHKPKFGGEKNSFQTMLYGAGNWLYKEMTARNQHLNLKSVVHETQSKDKRIESTFPRIKAKSVHVKPNDTEFILSLINYRPKASKRNDIADAFHKALRVATPAKKIAPVPVVDSFYRDRYVTTPSSLDALDLWTL